MDSQEKPGKKIYKRWWFWAIIVIVLIVIGSKSSSPHTVSSAQGTSTQPQQTVFKVGDQIQSGDSVLTVTKVNKHWQSSNEFNTPQNPGDVFVLVSVSIKNTGSSQLDLTGLDFKLQDATGAQHNDTFGVGINSLDNTSSLAPGGTVSGDELFEVPGSATSDLTLIYNPLFSLGQPIQVELQ